MNTGISILHQLVVWDCWTINYVSLEICSNQKISGILSSPEFPVVKKKNTMFHKNRPIPPRLHPTWRFIPWSLPCSRVAEHRTMLKGCCAVLGRASEPRAGLAALRSEGRGADCTSTCVVRNGSGSPEGLTFPIQTMYGNMYLHLVDFYG